MATYGYKTMPTMNLEQKIGQLFMLGFEGDMLFNDHPIARDISELHLGGVILFDRLLAKKKASNNIKNSNQLQQLTEALQALSATPLLIAIDQEGGKVCRLQTKHGFPDIPGAGELGLSNSLQKTSDAALLTARTLSTLGINWNMAPVVDLNSNPDNPVIGRIGRSFGADVDTVSSHAQAWIEQHRRLGILSCLKHFPGHGSSKNDSHLGFVDISDSWTDLELQPFSRLISQGLADAVMIGHLFHSRLDEHYPASLSSPVIEGTLRNRLDFQGPVVSDDMQMQAITNHYGLVDACCRAIAAGTDLIIIGNNLHHDPDILIKMIVGIKQGIDKGLVKEERIEQAWKRTQKLKQVLINKNAGKN